MVQPNKIKKILDLIRDDSDQKKWYGLIPPVELKNMLTDDHGLPLKEDCIKFEACLGKEEDSWNEYLLLYSFSKISDSSEYLGTMISVLGKMISRLSRVTGDYKYGIQEVDPGISDRYYILIYAIKET